MNWMIALLAAVVGYLVGSISFARIVTGIVAPGESITGIDFDEESTRQAVSAISGTAVSIKLGPKWGGLTAVFDILKAAVPALVFRLVYPEVPYFLISAGAGLLGHNWPLYYGFKGGMGLSPIYGGFLVLDFWGTLICALASMVLGVVVLRMIFVTFMGGLWLMIPWVWIRTGNLAYVAYVMFVNVVFFLQILPEIRTTIHRRRTGEAGDFSDSMDVTPMTKMIKRMAVKAGIMPEDEEPASVADLPS